MRRLPFAGAAIAGAIIVLLAGCDGGNIDGRGDGPGPNGDGGITYQDGYRPDVLGPSCSSNADCKGGVCVGGRCCATAKQACGETCCPTSKTCFANACVTPGKVCYSAGDCKAGQYCEPSLGPKGGAKADAGAGGVCLQPAPKAGRCLDLPKRCPKTGSDAGAASADAGTSPPAGCLQPCEFHPKAARLNAVPEWSWGAGTVKEYKNFIDVWSTPVVGRVTDTNCDGKVNELDPPNVIFVSGDAKGTCCSCAKLTPSTCHTGVLRVLDGASGKEIWSLRKASAKSVGFMGLTMALADIDKDGHLDIVAVTGEGYLVMIDHKGKVRRRSNKPIPSALNASKGVHRGFGWGGALAVADMDGDGFAEIAYGSDVFSTTGGKLTLKFSGKRGIGGGKTSAISAFSDVDGDGKQDLVVGNAAYRYNGTEIWYNKTVPDGYPAVADFDKNGTPEIAVVRSGSLWILDGKHGTTLVGPVLLAGTGSGGPPTIADFDGDGFPEVGVAKATFYSVTKIDVKRKTARTLWQQVNHDFSSSITGSTVFDFEGDGSAEVIYNDECFLWVYDGKTGAVRFATSTTSFTATEASLVADVDGDGRAEMVMISNGASPARWRCTQPKWTAADPKLGRPGWRPPKGQTAHRGITVWGDKAQSWVGTRTLWNQHTYHVSNICDDRDSACAGANNTYGAIPRRERQNWKVPWLNNFRQNVQDKGIFDAPDATVTLRIRCASPLRLDATLRNVGLALLPKAVKVGFYVRRGSVDTLLDAQTTKSMLFPGQATLLSYTTKAADKVSDKDTFVAKIIVDPKKPTFNECRADNNESAPASNPCVLK